MDIFELAKARILAGGGESDLIIKLEDPINLDGSLFDLITRVKSTKATALSQGVFSYLPKLKSVELPNVTVVGNSVFSWSERLTSASFPKATYLGHSAFEGCTALSNVDFPNIKIIHTFSFSECDSLTTVTFLNVEEVQESAFEECDNLAFVDLPKAARLGIGAFGACKSLRTLVLRSETMVSFMDGFGVFGDTPIDSGEGFIYVPRALVDSYKTASIWSDYATQFRALEDYTVDGTITGKLDMSKI